MKRNMGRIAYRFAHDEDSSLHHCVDSLCGSGSLSFMSAETFEYCDGLIKKYYETISRRLSPRVGETPENKGRALDCLQGPKDEVHRRMLAHRY